MDPSFATLGFINIAALEFIYKARKKKWEFPDEADSKVMMYILSLPLNSTPCSKPWLV
jgi:hypothetical protein